MSTLAYREAHREEARLRTKAWQQAYPERVYENNRRARLRKHGLTIEQYETMLTEQGGRCAACATDHPGPKAWHVDHDHKTGEVRGILCNNCNAALGMLADNPSRVLDLFNYITKNKKGK